jgi:hypothetical protein
MAGPRDVARSQKADLVALAAYCRDQRGARLAPRPGRAVRTVLPLRSVECAVGPAGGAPAVGVEGVAAVDDAALRDDVGDLGRVEFAEFAPFGQVQDHVGWTSPRGLDT